jgi:hypothetical protein
VEGVAKFYTYSGDAGNLDLACRITAHPSSPASCHTSSIASCSSRCSPVTTTAARMHASSCVSMRARPLGCSAAAGPAAARMHGAPVSMRARQQRCSAAAAGPQDPTAAAEPQELTAAFLPATHGRAKAVDNGVPRLDQEADFRYRRCVRWSRSVEVHNCRCVCVRACVRACVSPLYVCVCVRQLHARAQRHDPHTPTLSVHAHTLPASPPPHTHL